MSRVQPRLDDLDATLAHLAELVPDDKAAWDRDPTRQLAVERLWILAGNLAEIHRHEVGVPIGHDPWAELYDLRCVLAHQDPAQRNPDRVWAETHQDLDRIRAAVRSARRQA